MTRLLISTTSRHKLASQPSGHFYVVDVENKIIIQRSEIIEPPYREFDTNPRGGVRGVKGISVRDDLIALSNSSSVFLYDSNWKPIMSWGHPSCAGIHDIELQGECLWITSARNDLLFKIDLGGNLISTKNIRSISHIFKTFKWRPTPGLSQNQISSGKIDFRDPRSHDPNKSDAAHINSITMLPDGELLVSLGLLINQNFSRLLTIKKWLIDIGLWKKLLRINRSIRKTFSMKKNMHSDLVIQPASANSAVIRINKSSEFVPCISFSGVTVPSHSVRVLKDGTAVYLNTTSGEVLHFHPVSGEIFSTTTVGEKFLRGVCQLPDESLVIGDNNYLLYFDLKEQKILSRLLISPDTDEAIYDIKILPDHYALPPLSFRKHHQRHNSQSNMNY